jgi:hypothetical protein
MAERSGLLRSRDWGLVWGTIPYVLAWRIAFEQVNKIVSAFPIISAFPEARRAVDVVDLFLPVFEVVERGDRLWGLEP